MYGKLDTKSKYIDVVSSITYIHLPLAARRAAVFSEVIPCPEFVFVPVESSSTGS